MQCLSSYVANIIGGKFKIFLKVLTVSESFNMPFGYTKLSYIQICFNDSDMSIATAAFSQIRSAFLT